MHTNTILLDCDGVLTDGSVQYDEHGKRHKTFHSRDITGIQRLVKAGFDVWVLSKSTWPGLFNFTYRCKCTGTINVSDKLEWVATHLPHNSYIAIADDYTDLRFLQNAEIAFMPDNADRQLIQAMRTDVRNNLRRAENLIVTRSGGTGVIGDMIYHLQKLIGKTI